MLNNREPGSIMNNSSWYWPDVSDIDGAKDATRYGMWCAIAVAVVTAFFSLLALFGVRFMGASLASFVDAALFGAIAFGLSKYSRFAAVAGFTLFLIEKIYTFMMTGSILSVGVLGVVMLFGFLNGMRGAFAYQRLAAAASQPVPPAIAG
jgi:hypothetical protein